MCLQNQDLPLPCISQASLNRLRAEKDKEADVLKSTIAEFEKKAKAMTVSAWPPAWAQLLLAPLTVSPRCCSQDFLDRKDALEAELADLKADLAAKVKDYEYRLT